MMPQLNSTHFTSSLLSICTTPPLDFIMRGLVVCILIPRKVVHVKLVGNGVCHIDDWKLWRGLVRELVMWANVLVIFAFWPFFLRKYNLSFIFCNLAYWTPCSYLFFWATNWYLNLSNVIIYSLVALVMQVLSPWPFHSCFYIFLSLFLSIAFSSMFYQFSSALS